MVNYPAGGLRAIGCGGHTGEILGKILNPTPELSPKEGLGVSQVRMGWDGPGKAANELRPVGDIAERLDASKSYWSSKFEARGKEWQKIRWKTDW